jgi:hypothetical protein
MFQWMNPRAPDAMAPDAMAPNDMAVNAIDLVFYILSGEIINIKVDQNCNYVYNVYEVKITNNEKSNIVEFFDYDLMTEAEYKNNFVNKISQTTVNYCGKLLLNNTVYFAVPGQVLQRIDRKSYYVKPLHPIIQNLYGSSPIKMDVKNLMTEKHRDMFFKRKIEMPVQNGGGSRRRNKTNRRRRKITHRRNKRHIKSTRRRRHRKH